MACVVYLAYLLLLILRAYSELRSMPYFGESSIKIFWDIDCINIENTTFISADFCVMYTCIWKCPFNCPVTYIENLVYISENATRIECKTGMYKIKEMEIKTKISNTKIIQ
jgi:hypothetical protein